MNRIQLLLSTSLVGCMALAQPAFAQDTAAQASGSASNQPSNGAQIREGQTLQEVVVTAERRTSTAQKTAAAVSVRSGSDMLVKGRYELANIIEDVPGVVGAAAGSSGTAQANGSDNPAAGLTFRGVQSNAGAGASTTSTAAAAAIYVDDVYNGIGGGYDLDRVEVLRGPQGTLYGRSATAGVVAMHTHDPDATQFSADGAAEFGNYNLRHYTGGVNIPVIQDKLAVRLSGNYYDREGYYSAEGGAYQNQAFRAKALWTPTDNFSALLGYAQEYNVTHSGGIAIGVGSSPTDFTYTPQEVSPPGKNNSHQYWGNFNLDLGAVAITYIPTYRTWYQNGTTYLRGAVNADQTISTPTDWFLTHEVRIRNKDDDAKLKWQAGFLYYRNVLDNTNTMKVVPLGFYAFKSSSHKETTALGGFVEGVYSFSSETRLTVGARYDHTKILNTGDYTSALGITKSLTGNDGLAKFNNFTYKLRLEHDLTPANLLYASVSTGFSPGDITLTQDATYQPVKQVLKAETLTTYEVGSKNRFLDNRLQVNGTLYYNDYSGYQTAGINTSPDTPQTPTFETLVSPMKSYGAELEVQARPWANGMISMNASYTHARYGDFNAHNELFSKDEVPGVAPFRASLGYDHNISMGGAALRLHGDIRYASAHDTSSISDAWAQLGVGPYVRVSGQTIGNLNATLLLGEGYSITAYVRNVTDKRFIPDNWTLSSVSDQGVISQAAFTLSDPRTVGVVLSFKH